MRIHRPRLLFIAPLGFRCLFNETSKYFPSCSFEVAFIIKTAMGLSLSALTCECTFGAPSFLLCLRASEGGSE